MAGENLTPISYETQLSLERATEIFNEAQDVFDELKQKYTTGLRKYQFWLPKKDRSGLSNIIGALLPLSMQSSVQEQMIATKNPEQTIRYKSSNLIVKTMDMMASFKNTGTTRVGSNKPIWKD